MALIIVAVDKQQSKLPVVSEKPELANPFTDFWPSLPAKGFLVALAIAIISAGVLMPKPAGLADVGGGIAFILCLLAVYFIFHQHREAEDADEQSLHIMLPLQSTMWRVIAVLTMVLLVPTGERLQLNGLLILVVAMMKVCQWVVIIEMVRTIS